jgi:hypothetical protein
MDYLIFEPTFGVDYRLSFRARIAAAEGPYSKLLAKNPLTQDKRALLFRRDCKRVDATDDYAKRAILAHLSGVRQERRCEHCQGGSGPFEECVTHDGPCTNCRFSRSHYEKCNYHRQRKSPFHPMRI